MEAEPQYLADQRFFDLVNMPSFRGASLEVVSRQPARRTDFATPLIERIETAWRTPFAELSCYQVAGLLIQKMGLEWLAEPIVDFVTRYPAADTGHYPGEMIANMLMTAEEFHRHAAVKFRDWLARDSSTLDRLFGFSRSLRREVLANLERARRL